MDKKYIIFLFNSSNKISEECSNDSQEWKQKKRRVCLRVLCPPNHYQCMCVPYVKLILDGRHELWMLTVKHASLADGACQIYF